MLPGQERGGCHNRNLAAGHGHHKGCAQRDFRLAETHIAADEAVHRPPLGEIAEHILDRIELVIGFGVREGCAEFVIETGRNLDRIRLLGQALGRDLDQLVCHVAQAFFRLRLSRLPGHTAQLVQLRTLRVRAVAREEFNILDWQVELGLTGIFQLDAIMRRVLHRQGFQPDKTAQPVIGMNDQIARRERARLDNDVGALLALAWPGQTVAENVLFGQDRQRLGLETALDRQDGARDLGVRAGQHILPALGETDLAESVIAQHAGQAFRSALTPRG